MPVEFDSYDPDDGDTRLQFTADSNAFKILEFLASHPETGFKPKEISERTGVTHNSVGATLSRLEAQNLVRHKAPYWAIADDDRLGAFTAMIHGTAAAQDRFGDEDWGEWQETAVDPRDHDNDDGE
jgi:hypothetical protein